MTSLPDKENKTKYVIDIFNSIAPRYDILNTLVSFGLDKSWRRFAAKRTALGPGGEALDICCGTGKLTMELSRLAGPNGSVTGLDYSENMLAAAGLKIKNFAFKDNIRLIRENAMALPFAENTFDCATIAFGLRNLPDIETAVLEMIRVVKPGGKIVSLDMAQPQLPVFRQIYWFCFKNIIPAVGRLGTLNKQAYRYFYDSVRAFPPPDELKRIFSRCGLTETVYHNLGLGVVAVVEGKKPTQEKMPGCGT